MKPIFTDVIQVALIVRDVDATVRDYWDKYGIGPWKIFNLNPENVQDMIIDGKRDDFRYRQATTYIGNMHFELIQPLDDKGIYAEFLRDHGEGLHHIAFKTQGLDETMDRFAKLGKIEKQGGTISGKHKFAYVDCRDDMKMFVEFNKEEPGFVMPEAVAVYPEESRNS